MPKISIIMGIYNCAETLPEAIDSVLTQTFQIGSSFCAMMAQRIIPMALQKSIRGGFLRRFYCSRTSRIWA